MQTIVERWKRLLFASRCSFTIPAPLQPHLVPKALPELPLEIWLEIFQFATYVHCAETLRPLNPFTPRRTTTNAMGANTPSLAMRTKLALVLVSRAWRRVSLHLLYRHIVIRSPTRANAILSVLEVSRRQTPLPPPESEGADARTRVSQNLGYGEWTRHIEVYTYVRGSGDINFLHTVFKIFRHCPNVHYLTGKWGFTGGSPLPIEFLQGITGLFATCLQGLFWAHDSIATLEFLGTFQSLRVLDLRHFTHPTLRSPSSLKPLLPCLQDLILSNQPQSFQAATDLDLPKLRNLTLRTTGHETGDNEHMTAFLKAHGHSLISVDLPPPGDVDLDLDNAPIRRDVEFISPDIFLAENVCPNLESLVFSCAAPRYLTNPHPNLRRVGIRGITAEFLYPDKPSLTKSHLTALTVQRYPQLELVQMVGFLVEAHADSILKDACIWWAEKFEKSGVLFLDGECVLWAYTEPDVQSPIAEQAVRTSKASQTLIMAGVEKESREESTKMRDKCDAVN